jgi:indole-3-glycerol phosphate synthase
VLNRGLRGTYRPGRERWTAPTILDKIKAYKLEEIAAAKAALPLARWRRRRATRPACAPSRARWKQRSAAGYGLIAEIKKASPSKGLIRADFDPPALARPTRPAARPASRC